MSCFSGIDERFRASTTPKIVVCFGFSGLRLIWEPLNTTDSSILGHVRHHVLPGTVAAWFSPPQLVYGTSRRENAQGIISAIKGTRARFDESLNSTSITLSYFLLESFPTAIYNDRLSSQIEDLSPIIMVQSCFLRYLLFHSTRLTYIRDIYRTIRLCEFNSFNL